MPTRKLSVPCFTHSDLARSAPAGFLRMRSNNTARGMLFVVVCGETNKQGWWFKTAPKACMHSSLRVTVVGVVCDFGSEKSLPDKRAIFITFWRRMQLSPYCHMIVFCWAVQFSFNFQRLQVISVQYHTLEIECQFLVSAQSHMPHFSSLELQ